MFKNFFTHKIHFGIFSIGTIALFEITAEISLKGNFYLFKFKFARSKLNLIYNF